MHVYTLVPSLRMGGAEIQALRNCEALLGAGYAVTLVTLFNVDGDFYAPYLADLKRRGLHFHALLDREVPQGPAGPVHFLTVLAQCAARLRLLYEEERPDVVYTRLWYASLVAWVTRAIARHRPRLVFNEESRLEASGLKARARLFLLKRAGLWLVPCRGLYEEAIALGTPVATGRVLPNIVARTRPGRSRTRLQGPLVLGFLGRLEHAKGLDRLLDVASGLLASGRPFQLRIAGSGSLEASLWEEVARRGLGGHVSLLGAVKDVDRFFAGVDLLLLTSRYEGFANVIVEANACGVPALAMRVPHGPADVIREGLNGFLVGDGDVEAMVDFLKSVDVERLARMRAPCQDLAEKAYSIGAQQQRWIELLGVSS